MARSYKKEPAVPDRVIAVGILDKQSEKSQIRVAISVWPDAIYLDIRKWYCTQADPKFKPGRGISIPIKKLLRLKKLVTKAMQIAVDEDLV